MRWRQRPPSGRAMKAGPVQIQEFRLLDLALDETHDPAARSWVVAASHASCDFPIQNLPLGIFRRAGTAEPFRGGVAIGDQVLDLKACASLLDGRARAAAEAASGPTLAPLMALPPEDWAALRRGVFALLREGGKARDKAEPHLVPIGQVEMSLPAKPGAYVDFFASIQHATNAGRLFRPDNPLLPSYRYVPIAYHGRASTLRPSGAPVRRPSGQTKRPDETAPSFGPSRRLDYEVELGLFLGGTTKVGSPVPVGGAGRHLFGVCLLNDWSARDIQAWEYQPLGPFLGKSFATTISAWIVTADALRPFRTGAARRDAGEPAPLPYLFDTRDQEQGAFEIFVEGWLRTPGAAAPCRLSRASASTLYWTPAQMIAHLTSNGCNLEPGDLLGTGTISGPDREGLGSLLELSHGGADPFLLPGGTQRTFLEDGDEVILRAECLRSGFARIGFGDCAGRIVSPGERS